eukprot:8328852-Karenia_brevis.AAC.1
MAVAWCHRMQYFFDLWQQQDEDFYIYTDRDHASYKETLEFVDLQLEKLHSNPVYEVQLRKIKAIFPRA